jgi:hypothetical protein
MLSIAPSGTGPTPSTHGTGSASQQPPLRHGSAGTPVGGRSRAPEAAPAAGRESDSGRPDANRGTGLNPATAGGLVLWAKSVRNPVEGRVDVQLSAANALGLRFPSPDFVTSAAALFERAQPWAHGRDRLAVEPESGQFSGSRLAPAWSASAERIPFARKRHSSGQSTAPDST